MGDKKPFNLRYSLAFLTGITKGELILIINESSGGHQPSSLVVHLSDDAQKLMRMAIAAEVDEYQSVMLFAKLRNIEHKTNIDEYREYLRLKAKWDDK